jgi:hypothetical protein
MRQWLYFDEVPERVVDADPAPSPPYAQPTPADAASQSHATQRRQEVARVALAILLPLVGVGVWLLLALPVGVGSLAGLDDNRDAHRRRLARAALLCLLESVREMQSASTQLNLCVSAGDRPAPERTPPLDPGRKRP